ncbi:hypothetical protein ZIOFF_064600 [Zingiber officinale]|uniref:C2 domain-containing protein n=1 Tax=Zingiber officinale TaxID=94328 RepID=A0A8J5KGH4_ZINOF|nr:hypothetical protein ZIOFF_064600 [Zingiber officinale]
MKGPDLAMEVTVISAEDLNDDSSVFGFRLRPFVTAFAGAAAVDCDRLPMPLQRTRLADGSDPAWGDLLRIPLDPSFLVSTRGGDDDDAGICLVVLSKRPLGGAARLGWCRIPPADVLDGLRHPSAIRRLSYALRHPRHGGRSRGVVHVAVRLVGRDINRLLRPQPAPALPPQQPGWGGVAMGIPVVPLGSPPCWSGFGVDSPPVAAARMPGSAKDARPWSSALTLV